MTGGEAGAPADVVGRIGRRIRELRSARGLTVQHLADRAEVSRRLLTEIELGRANPGLASVNRIAQALGVDFATLAGPRDDQPAALAVQPEGTLIWSSPAGSAAHLLTRATRRNGAELWRWHLVPDDGYPASPDPAGSEELFHVLRGELTVVTDADRATVAAGQSARLASDRLYRYENHGAIPAEFVRVVDVP